MDNIAKSLATPDERKVLAAYQPLPSPASGHPAAAELGAPEQLLLGLMGIPTLEVKLGCIKLVNSFKPRIGMVADAADVLFSACKVCDCLIAWRRGPFCVELVETLYHIILTWSLPCLMSRRCARVTSCSSSSRYPSSSGTSSMRAHIRWMQIHIQHGSRSGFTVIG